MNVVENLMAESARLIEEIFPMARPRILVTTAQFGSKRYHRSRDLPGAVPGLLAEPDDKILPRLAEAEARCEADRRAKSAAYRPARHVQVLAALLAETRIAQANASGSAALRWAT